jgi:hypothetical protein
MVAFRSFAIAPKKKPGKPDSSGAMRQPLLGIPSEGTALENYMRDTYTPVRRDHLPEKQERYVVPRSYLFLSHECVMIYF